MNILRKNGIIFLYLFLLLFTCCKSTSSNEQTSSAALGPGQNLPSLGIHGPYIIDATTAFDQAFITASLTDIGAQYARVTFADLSTVAGDLNANGIMADIISGVEPTSEFQTAVANYKDQIYSWEIGNEPDKSYANDVAGYVNFLKARYAIIKQQNPSATVVIGGFFDGETVSPSSPGPVFLDALLKAGGGDYFDVFNFKAWGRENDYGDLANTVAVYRNILGSYSYLKPIWISEESTYDGSPNGFMPDNSPWPSQTEAQQAGGLIKRFVNQGSLGIERAFWNLIVERHNFGGFTNNFFDNVGLVNNPANDGNSSRKLSYYSFKKMSETLGGSDSNSLRTVRKTSDSVYIYKLTKSGKAIYVAWWDAYSGTPMNVALTGLRSRSALVTSAVPSASSGDQITDYSTAFPANLVPVVNGTVSVGLSDNPVYVQEQ